MCLVTRNSGVFTHRDEARDRSMARNVFRFHSGVHHTRCDLDHNLFVGYLAYCRSRIDPVMGEEAAGVLKSAVGQL